MNSNAAIRLADPIEQRLSSCAVALENLLREESDLLLGSTREVHARLVARREFRGHRIAVVGVSSARLCAALEHSPQSEIDVHLDGDLTVSLVIAESEKLPSGIEACLDFRPGGDGQNVRGLLVQRVTFEDERLVIAWPPTPQMSPAIPMRQMLSDFLASSAYRSHYRASYVDEVLEIETAMRAHCRTIKAATAARRDFLGRQASRVSSAATPDRSAVDAARAEIADSLSLLGKNINENLRRALGPEGRIQSRMTAEIGKLGDTDLSREAGKKSIRLTVSAETQNELLRVVRELTEAEVKVIVGRINASLRQISTVVLHGLLGVTGTKPEKLAATVSGEGVFEKAIELVQVVVKYRGTMPLRGFFQRLAEGRRSIFAVLMFFSLFGSFLGFNWRTIPILGLIFMCGFIFAVFYTYRSWVEEDAERIGDEIDKAREHLQMELRRVMSEVVRELQAGFADILEFQKRGMLAKLDGYWREVAGNAQREAQELREATQLALKQIDVRDRQLQDFVAALTRLDADFRVLRAQAPR
jgi:hypothetical protein